MNRDAIAHTGGSVLLATFAVWLCTAPSAAWRACAAQPGHDAPAPVASRARGLPSSQLIERSGDLESYLKSIDYGAAGDQRWYRPSRYAMTQLDSALRELVAGNVAIAAKHAGMIGFQLIAYADPAHGQLYVLRDTPDAANVARGGTYVWNPAAPYDVVIEVPHPKFDMYTADQGVELFLAARAAMLLLSGTHRRSDPVRSTCSGSVTEGYQRSDPAHAHTHFFQVAHQVADSELTAPLFLQLHGFGDAAYERLASQCKPGFRPAYEQLLINVSDAHDAAYGLVSLGLMPNSFARVLIDTVGAHGTIAACMYNEDTWEYGGTLNLQGRYTNGSPDPCHQPAITASGRFIHLEQSFRARRDHRALVVGLYAEALARYYTDRTAPRRHRIGYHGPAL